MKQSQRSADIVSLARAGVPYSVIGERYGVTRQAVSQMARRSGIQRFPARGWAHLKDPKARASWLRGKAERRTIEAAGFIAEAARVEAGDE